MTHFALRSGGALPRHIVYGKPFFCRRKVHLPIYRRELSGIAASSAGAFPRATTLGISPQTPSMDQNGGTTESFDYNSFRNTFSLVRMNDSLERVINRHMLVTLSGAETAFRMLAASGVKVVFGYSGGAVLPLIDQFSPNKHIVGEGRDAELRTPGEEVLSLAASIPFIGTVTEATAAHAAQAMGRLTGRPGICVVTSGPGLTNCITALQDALMDGDPMLILSGQVSTEVMGTDAFQECPATALTRPCTKWNHLCTSVESIPWAIDTALRIAMSGRKGPVHVDLPKNVVTATGDTPVTLLCPGTAVRDLTKAADDSNRRLLRNFDPNIVDDIHHRICSAKRPVIIAGKGAIASYSAVRELAVRCNIPVTTTLHGVGIFDEKHPLSLHMLGMYGAAYANYAVQNADLVLSFGCRFDDRATGAVKHFAPYTRRNNGGYGIVAVDIDPARIARTVRPDVSAVADCNYVLSKLLDTLPLLQHTAWLEQIEEWKQRHPFSVSTTGSEELRAPQAIQALYKASAKSRRPTLVTTGVGNHQMMTAQFFRWSFPGQFLSSGGLGTMGVGLPFAIGAIMTRPDCNVLLIDGDGSFNMSATSLATLMRVNLPVRIAIMNDGMQQMVRTWQKLYCNERFIATDNTNPDYVQLAKSYGISAISCKSSADVDGAAQWLMEECDAPRLVDFHVRPGEMCLPMVQPGCPLDEMILMDDSLPAGLGTGPAPS